MQQGFTFQSTRSVLAEAGASARIGELAQARGCRSVVLVSDRGIVDAGLLEPTLASPKRFEIYGAVL